MCGIAAITLALPQQKQFSTQLLDELEQALVMSEPPAGLSDLLHKAAAELGPGSFTLVENLLETDGFAERLVGLVEKLATWLERDDVPELDGAIAGGGEQKEASILREQVLDLRWTVNNDTLGNLQKVKQLLTKATNGQPLREGLFTAFQLNLTLNALSRLEVRGRDSLGLSVQVIFHDTAMMEALEQAIGGGMRKGLEQRLAGECFLHHTVLRHAPATGPACYTFVWKVAAEVGSLGDNPDFLRRAIMGDCNFWQIASAPGSTSRVLSHTRWASNGVISEANCHPVADLTTVETEDDMPGVVAVLNGDVDNYQELRAKYAALGWRIDERVTTDVQIIPLVVSWHLRQTGNLMEAFRLAMEEMEGSMAVGVFALSDPTLLLVGLSGSGQALFAGEMPGGVAISSEVYGVVETCASFRRVPGVEQGEKALRPGSIFAFKPGMSAPAKAVFLDGSPLPEELLKPFASEISTRDIDLGDHDHYLIKEISEAERSFRKTIAGKFRRTKAGTLESVLLGTSIPLQLAEDFRERRIKRVFCIGQGTAGVAAEAVCILLRNRLAPARIHAEAILASELSGFHPDDDLSDTLIVAVSQSGTTTDTNRTVDVARSRGAAILAIVNRRNSDLVYKSDGVIYTSDGRDVEMSVASTKAFYSQVAAGQLLSLSLAQILGLASSSDLEREVATLEEVPGMLRDLFSRREEIGKIAAQFAPSKRYWATVGNGSGKVAAREIRIKLSELCYKSIPTDITEDKKHIDLSTEPLILLCAAGLEEAILADVVKESAIFKAHSATPIVITHEGENRFAPYASAVINVPLAKGGLSFVPVTMAGHLWGYYAALAIDEGGRLLRRIRSLLVELAASTGGQDEGLREKLNPLAISFIEELVQGRLDGGLDPSVGGRIAILLERVLSGIQTTGGVLQGVICPTSGVTETIAQALTEVTRGIDALLRPIDAIKHQAKTVTVGISRAVETLPEPFLAPLKEEGITAEQMRRGHRDMLVCLAPLVEDLGGFTLYEVDGLARDGSPTAETSITLLSKTGSSSTLTSRAESGTKLAGSKWLVVKRGEMFFGRGGSDDRPVIIMPLYERGRCRRLVLCHIRCQDHPQPEVVARALENYHNRLDKIRAEVTERNQAWDEALLEKATVPQIFSAPIDTIVDQLLGAR